MNRRFSMILTCVCVAMISATAVGQGIGSGASAPPPEGKKGLADPRRGGTVLSGPAAGQQGDPRRAGRKGAERNRRAMELPPRAWLQAVRSLELNEEQTTQLDSIVAEFQEASRKYTSEHIKAMQDLRARMREAVQNGEKPEGLREELKAIQAQAPKFEDTQKQIWELLTPDQREQLKTKLEELREKMSERARGPQDRSQQAGRSDMSDRSKGREGSAGGRVRSERQRAPKSGGSSDEPDGSKQQGESGDSAPR